MRKLFNFLCLAALSVILFTGCTKDELANTLGVSNSKITFTANVDLTQSIEITSNSSWKITEYDSEWITVSDLQGSGDQTIEITAKENISATQRSTALTLYTDELMITLNISQSNYVNIIDFEDITIDPITKYTYGTYTNETTQSGEKIYAYSKYGASFKTFVNEMYQSWGGAAYSFNTDMTTEGFFNQYSVYNTSGYNKSKNFLVFYHVIFMGPAYTPAITFEKGKTEIVDHLYMNNSTWAALSMKNGDAIAKKFTNGDWYKVTITGIDANNKKGTPIDFYLADFRNGKTFFANEWTKVDLSELGEVNKITFELSSSDNGTYGMNTPAYLCIDNIAIRK